MPIISSFQSKTFGWFLGQKRKIPQYIFGETDSSAGTTSSNTHSFSTNFINSQQENDIIIVVSSVGGGSGTTVPSTAPTTSGYSKIDERSGESSPYHSIFTSIYYKKVGATAETSITFPSTGSSANARSTVMQIWRNIDVSGDSPIDINLDPEGSFGLGSAASPFSSTILSSQENSVLFLVNSTALSETSVAGYDNGPTDSSNFLSTFGSDTVDSICGIASYFPSVGEERAFSSFGYSGTASSSDVSAIRFYFSLKASY